MISAAIGQQHEWYSIGLEMVQGFRGFGQGFRSADEDAINAGLSSDVTDLEACVRPLTRKRRRSRLLWTGVLGIHGESAGVVWHIRDPRV